MKRVIVIDDMIHDSELIHKYTESIYEVNDDYAVIKKNITEIKSVAFDTHADLCAKVIKKYCPEVRFINIVIKETFSKGDVKKLIAALEFSGQLNADVVHMSVGTNRYLYIHRMHKVIKKLAVQVTLVAAKANNNRKTFPADFVEVIGCKNSEKKEVQSLGKNNYALAGCHLIRGNNNRLFYTSPRNSFSAAYYTGLYCCGSWTQTEGNKALHISMN